MSGTPIIDTADPDQDPMYFATMLAVLGQYQIQIERYNLGQHPDAFAANPAVKALLTQMGIDVLPIILWDGKIRLTGRYPNADERHDWFRAAALLSDGTHA